MSEPELNTIELGPIRPPSEAYSLLLRITRNCPWNRCRFCHLYKGTKFEIRPVAEIKQEIETVRSIVEQIKNISVKNGCSVPEAAAMVLNAPSNDAFYSVALWQYCGGESVFLQDANTLIMPTEQLLEIILFLKTTFPTVKRITSYGRSHTAARKKPEELHRLYEAGLSRIHIGLESGYDPLLQYVDKGVTAADHIKGGKNIVNSGISLSEYVVLGLGGKTMSHEHAVETARVLNEINPDFIRIRTFTLNNLMPMYDDVVNGKFIRLTDDEIAREERLLIENLECTSTFVSDHATNLFQEFEGKLPGCKTQFLATIDRFLALNAEERMYFKIGRRLGVYSCLEDLTDADKRNNVERIMTRLTSNGRRIDDATVQWLMERFI